MQNVARVLLTEDIESFRTSRQIKEICNPTTQQGDKAPDTAIRKVPHHCMHIETNANDFNISLNWIYTAWLWTVWWLILRDSMITALKKTQMKIYQQNYRFLVQTVCSSSIVCLSDVGDLVALGRVGSLCSIGNFSVQGACQRLVTWVTTGRIW